MHLQHLVCCCTVQALGSSSKQLPPPCRWTSDDSDSAPGAASQPRAAAHAVQHSQAVLRGGTLGPSKPLLVCWLGTQVYSTPAVCSNLRLFLPCCCAALCCAVLCCAVLCCAVLCCAVLCCAVLCCVYTLQRCAVLCCAVPSWYMCTSPSCNSAVWQAAVSPSHQFLSFQPLHSVSLALLAFFSACAAGIRISAQPISKTSLNSVMTAAAVSSSQLQKAAAVHWY